MVKKVLIPIILSLMILFTSCWDYRDINQRTIELSIGVDLVDDEIEFSGEFARLISESKSATGSAEISGVYRLSERGKTFEETRAEYDSKINYPDFSAAARVVIFGENFAKSGIESYLNRVLYLPTSRNSMLITVSKETPKKLLERKFNNDISIGNSIENMIRYLTDEGACIYTTILDIHSHILIREMGFVLPIIEYKGDSLALHGFAVMKDAKMIGEIDLKESKGVIYLKAKKPSYKSLITVEGDENRYSLTGDMKRKIKTDYKNGRIIIKIDIDAGAKLMYQYINTIISNKTLDQIEEIAKKEIKKDIMDAIEKSQKEFETDYLEFLRYFRAQNPEAYKKVNWKDEYPNAEVNVNVDFKLLNQNLIQVGEGEINPNKK